VLDLICEVVNPGRRAGILFLHGFLGDKDEFRHIGQMFERTHTVAYGDLVCHSVLDTESRAQPCILADTASVDSAERIALPGTVISSRQSSTLDSVSATSRTHGVTNAFDKPTQWHIIGYSMGGRIALQLACRFPQLVRRLTLISASPGLESSHARRARLLADQRLAQQLRRSTMREFLNHWYHQPLFKEFRTHPSFLAQYHRRLRQDPVVMAQSLEDFSVGAQPSLWAEIPRLRFPFELICGERDTKFVDIARRMQALNPQIHLTVVAKAGHVVHWEAPNAVRERISHVEYRMAPRPEF
jgi:2-succinyl-6-hydroxy-2,4-cyclohexadiene-1-carboxylate synthase